MFERDARSQAHKNLPFMSGFGRFEWREQLQQVKIKSLLLLRSRYMPGHVLAHKLTNLVYPGFMCDM